MIFSLFCLFIFLSTSLFLNLFIFVSSSLFLNCFLFCLLLDSCSKKQTFLFQSFQLLFVHCRFWSLLCLLSFVFNSSSSFIWTFWSSVSETKKMFFRRKRRLFMVKKIIKGIEKNEETCQNTCFFGVQKVENTELEMWKCTKLVKRKKEK